MSEFIVGDPILENLLFKTGDDDILRDVKKILRWRWRQRGNKKYKEHVMLWKGFLMSDVTWVLEDDFTDPQVLQKSIAYDKP